MEQKELKDTVNLMLSDNYIERFLAEYYQTKTRYDRLHYMIIKYEAGTLAFDLKCPINILKDQAKYMGMYLYELEVRAEIEGIKL